MRTLASLFTGFLLLLIVSLFTFISPVYSAPINISDFSGSETVIDFDSLSNGTVLTNQFGGDGITFQNNSGSTTIDNRFSSSLSSSPNVAWAKLNSGGYQELLFSTSVRLLGLDLDGSVGETFIMNVFDSSGFVESITGANNSFLGTQITTDITRVEVRSSTDGFNFIFDDVRFETTAPVPVPSALLLLGSGLLALVGVSRKKTA